MKFKLKRIKYDTTVIDSEAYIHIAEGEIATTTPISAQVWIDHDKEGNVLGIEILNMKLNREEKE
jgi:uncharacterized protein YuzE